MSASDQNIQQSPFPTPPVPDTDIYGLVKANFEKYATKIAVVDVDNGKSYTFAMLEDEVEVVAYNLSEYGMVAGDTLVVFAQNCVEYLIMMLATWRLGGIFCGIHFNLKENELEDLLSQVSPNYLFTDVSCADVILPVARTLPSMKITDINSGESLGPDHVGEICLRGDHVMVGYLNNPTANAETIDPDGWLHSGDVGYYDKNGAFFFIDRLKDMIRYKGYQVASSKLEDVLGSHPLVTDSAVIGIPDKDVGQLPLAWVVKKEGAEITENEIIDFIAGKVEPYEQLRGGVTFVDAIPKSPTGKIKKQDIRCAASRPGNV